MCIRDSYSPGASADPKFNKPLVDTTRTITAVSYTHLDVYKRQDFTIDPYQIYLARYYQADACLLMLSVLDDEQYRQLSAVAHSLNMGVLTEVSNEEELELSLIHISSCSSGYCSRSLASVSVRRGAISCGLQTGIRSSSSRR